MNDKDKFQKLIAQAGFKRNVPAIMARILVENGATFLDTREIDYCNGKASMRKALIHALVERRAQARGAAKVMLTDIITMAENLEVI